MSERQPFDRGAERAVLAACLVSKLARAEARLHLVGGDFYEPRHEALWEAMNRLDRFGKPIEPTTILAVTQRSVPLVELLSDLVTEIVSPEHVAEYASIVRSWATKRAVWSEAQTVARHALDPDVNAVGYVAGVVNRFAAIRDSGAVEDVASRTLAEVLADPDDEPDWLIPGYLERRDRLILTGDEGLGKSHLLRQFALSAAAGVDPFDCFRRHKPVRVMVVDCENGERQVRASARRLAQFVQRNGAPGMADRVFLNCRGRMDVTRDRDLAALHREVDAWQPDLVILGPIYKLVPRAMQTDDEAAPFLAAMDTLRERGPALILEAHAGHGVKGSSHRDMRPRGSSALLGWPEFGYGLRRLTGKDANGPYCAFQAWRGDRSERQWPHALRRDSEGVRWVPYDGPTENEWRAA